MNAIIKPVALGVVAYIISAVRLWFVLSFVLFPVMPNAAFWLLPAVTTLVPLFLSGYAAASFTVSSHRSRKVAIGVVAGLIGFGISMVVTQAQGQVWFFVLFILGAAVVSALGSFLGARQVNAL